jgi:hypothetical protein
MPCIIKEVEKLLLRDNFRHICLSSSEVTEEYHENYQYAFHLYLQKVVGNGNHYPATLHETHKNMQESTRRASEKFSYLQLSQCQDSEVNRQLLTMESLVQSEGSQYGINHLITANKIWRWGTLFSNIIPIIIPPVLQTLLSQHGRCSLRLTSQDSITISIHSEPALVWTHSPLSSESRTSQVQRSVSKMLGDDERNEPGLIHFY